MTREPLISIVIPAYNVGSYISDCMQSVFGQTYRKTEVIVVNDGSTDNTEEVIESSKFFSDIKYIKQDNTGVSGARNRALGAVTGEYVLFIDADDIVDSRYIEVLLKNISGADVSVCSHANFREGGSLTNLFNYVDDIYKMSGSDLLAEVLYGDRVSSGPHGKLFSINTIKGVLFDTNVRIGEDLDYIAKICEKSNLKVVYTKSKLYGYRERQGSAMNSGYSSAYRQYYRIARAIYEKFSDANQKIKSAASYRLFGVSSLCIAISDSHEDDKMYMTGIDDTKYSVVRDYRSSVKNRILAISYIINSRLTNFLRLKLWQK